MGLSGFFCPLLGRVDGFDVGAETLGLSPPLFKEDVPEAFFFNIRLTLSSLIDFE